jgi:hypothetical protein
MWILCVLYTKCGLSVNTASVLTDSPLILTLKWGCFIYNPLLITAEWLSVRGMRSGWGNRSVCAISKLQFHFSQLNSVFRLKGLRVKLGAPRQDAGVLNCSKSIMLHKWGHINEITEGHIKIFCEWYGKEIHEVWKRPVKTYHSAWCNIPEDLNVLRHLYENIKCPIMIILDVSQTIKNRLPYFFPNTTTCPLRTSWSPLPVVAEV